ncbi:MAG: sulfatase, partial [Verrucomicrobia bacterium]
MIRVALRIGFALVLVLAASVGAGAAPERARPNILFIITDDQDLAELGYLQGRALTPNIDRLAMGGIRFNRAYVATSICTPSRYSCLTGQYASRSCSQWFEREITAEGVTRVLWNIGLTPGQPTLPKVLRASGYRTGFVGKWHIGGMSGMKRVEKGADPADPEVRALLEENQRRAAEILRGYGFDFAKSIYMGNPNDDRSLVNCGMNVHNMEWLTQAGLEFIDENRDAPFFLYFSTTLTHVPKPLDSLRGDPRASGVGLLDEPISGVQPSRESVMRRCQEAGVPEALWAATWLDDGIGALVDRLDRHGLLENTLIFYFVDNGMAEHAKGTCYEGGLIVPTFVHWKGHIEPAESDVMIQNIDFTPTILDAAGVPPPEDMVIDGMSFLPLLRGEPFEG